MRRIEAVEAVVNTLDDQLVVHATGMISRESCHVQDRDENFYMIGSMGLNSAIGLGVAINCPGRDVVVLDGDGSVLMNMGILASVGELGPKNFVHIVLDNESYASTGGQRSISDGVALEQMAAAAGYKYAARADTSAALALELDGLWTRPRPAFLLVKVEPGNESDIPRVSLSPPEIRSRFMRAVNRRGNRRQGDSG